MMQVPCKGSDDDASLEVDYCFAWQELAPGLASVCQGVNGVVVRSSSSDASECGCGTFAIDDIKVCPVSSIAYI